MVIVVTGATRGIGKAIVEKFLKDRTAHHFYLCARNGGQLKALKKSVETSSNGRHKATVFPADIGVEKEVKAFAAKILNGKAPVDLLFNNAGIYIPGSCYSESEGLLEKMIQVNLYGAYHLTRALLPPMIKREQGHIFNLCSIASIQAYSNGGSYSISKYALSGFTRNLREELKPFYIKVTGVYPGATLSSSWDGFPIPPDRLMEVEDVAKMIHAAASLSKQAVVEDIILRPQLGDL